MKYLKSVLIIAVAAFIAGIVVWHLTWMKEIERKFKEEQLSVGAKNNIEVKEKRSKDHKVKVETENAGPDVSISVQRKQVPGNQEVQVEQENEKPGNSKVEHSAELPAKEAKPELLRETGRWFEKDTGLGKKNVEARSEPGKTTTETLKSKTITVTTTNKAGQIKQNKTSPLPSPPPPTEKHEVKTPAPQPHPTSTAP